MFDKNKKKTDINICFYRVLCMYCKKLSFVFYAEYIDRFFRLVYKMSKKIKKLMINK